ncbi:MAG: hypothetical protein AAF541_04255 [Pseudomonadota bacterium]
MKKACSLLALWTICTGVDANVDLSGTYDVGTLTPLERPETFGNNLYLSSEQADVMAKRIAGAMAADSANSNPDRQAPPSGKITQGYNLFWVDPGSEAAMIDGKFRTSILTYPANGRIPALTKQGEARKQQMLDDWEIIWRFTDPTVGKNTGTAWWLEDGNSNGPYDHMEQRPYSERCIFGTRSTAGPPMLPNFYNNHKRIVQTPDHVMILTEMNHDARIVRMNAKHRDPRLKDWFGDSVGYWEGDTLIVDTRNFHDTPALWRADENLQTKEFFTLLDNGDLLYRFEVLDPTVWQDKWGGEYIWRAAHQDKVYEFACHEGNYALGNIMRGARLLEAEAKARAAGE